MDRELTQWYNAVPYAEIKNIIRDRMSVMAREYVGIGFYLRRVRDNKMYLEDGYKDVHEFAMAEFGMSRSTVNHCIRINEQFSVDGNSPTIDGRYKDFNKSQLQEMLYLTEDKLDEVTPDMTIKEIRGLKADRLDVEPETDDQIPGQMSIDDYPECMPGDKSDQKHNEPVSVLGYPMRVYPEGSLIATPGCGKQDCFCCHYEGCEICGKECYCVEATMANPSPCTVLNVVDSIRQDIGDKCQFVNKDLAFHRAGDGQPVPCCKQCENPCGYECRRSVEKRHTDVRDKESNKTKPENQEKSSCPPDVHSCIREEWGTDPEQQHEGAKECAKCWSEWKKRQEVFNDTNKTVVESDKSVIEADENVIDAEVQQDQEDIDDEQPEEFAFRRITAQSVLKEARDNLDQYLDAYKDEDVIPEFIERQKIIVNALISLVNDLEKSKKTEPVQPELPILKNNDQRKAFLDNYQTWPIWFEVSEASEVYHRFDLTDGSSIVICEYHLYLEWKERYTDENPNSIATREYLLKPGYHYLHDCLSNRTALVEHLKEVQKK